MPLTLGLLVDTSGSQRQVLGQERSASARFIDQVIREDKDMAFVIHFDFETELLQDLTSSRKKLRQAIQDVQPPQLQRRQQGGGGGGYPGGGRQGRGGGGTVLYDAVMLASDELMRNQSGRKALILLTDGVDTGSKVSINEAIESAQRSDTLIYSILFYDEQAYGGQMGPMMGGGRRRGGGPPMRIPVQNHPDGKKILQRMSRETGGGFFEVSKKVPIEETFERIQEELRSQYSIGYSSDKQNAGSGFRAIRLTTTQKALIVQTRDKYYATR